MPRTKETTVYQFDELSDRAKAKARDWYREGLESSDYADHVIEDATRIGSIIGIEFKTHPVKLMGGTTRHDPSVYWSGFSSQGDGACFEATYSYQKGSVAKLAAEAPPGEGDDFKGNNTINQIAKGLADLQKAHGYKLMAYVSARGNSSHSSSMTVDVYKGDTDLETSANPRDFAAGAEVTQLLRDFADWIYQQLEAEYEYQTSDETVDEMIRANEYEFDEDGHRA